MKALNCSSTRLTIFHSVTNLLKLVYGIPKVDACNLLNVLWLVLIGDGNVPATGYQINSATFAKLLIINRECKFHNSFNIVIPRMLLVFVIEEQKEPLTRSTPSYGVDPHRHPPYLEE
jgi:hypothetical protein